VSERVPGLLRNLVLSRSRLARPAPWQCPALLLFWLPAPSTSKHARSPSANHAPRLREIRLLACPGAVECRRRPPCSPPSRPHTSSSSTIVHTAPLRASHRPRDHNNNPGAMLWLTVPYESEVSPVQCRIPVARHFTAGCGFCWESLVPALFRITNGRPARIASVPWFANSLTYRPHLRIPRRSLTT